MDRHRPTAAQPGGDIAQCGTDVVAHPGLGNVAAGQAQQVFRWIQRRIQQAGKHTRRHLALVVRHRVAAGGDVEHAAGGAPVIPRVVQHPLQQPVGIDIGRMEIRFFQRQ